MNLVVFLKKSAYSHRLGQTFVDFWRLPPNSADFCRLTLDFWKLRGLPQTSLNKVVLICLPHTFYMCQSTEYTLLSQNEHKACKTCEESCQSINIWTDCKDWYLNDIVFVNLLSPTKKNDSGKILCPIFKTALEQLAVW